MQKWNLLKKTAPCILSLAVAATTFPTAVMASDLDAAVVSEARGRRYGRFCNRGNNRGYSSSDRSSGRRDRG